LLWADALPKKSSLVKKKSQQAHPTICSRWPAWLARWFTRFGMSDKLGPVALGRQQGNMFLGRDIAAERDFSEETAATIDSEVRGLVDQAYTRAKQGADQQPHVLDQLAKMLVDKETVDSEELQHLLATNDVSMASIV
jgi:cell division protease FtsH